MIRIWSHLAQIWPSNQQGDHGYLTIHIGQIRDEKLPPELWAIILNIVLDEARRPYLYCSPKTFPRFQQRSSLLDRTADCMILHGWKNIRLVCRTWRRLAGPQPYLHLKRTPDKRSVKALSGVSSILVGSDVDHTRLMMFLLQNQNCDFSHNLTSVSLSRNFPDDCLKILLDNPSSFRSLRCLTVHSVGDVASFWKAIQDRYPKLTALTIGGYLSRHNGHYILPNLQVLDMPSWYNAQLSCPSLKHLTLRYGLSPSSRQFLLDHGHQLESIMFENHFMTNIRDNLPAFWTILPNIETLGMDIYSYYPQQPPDHPLRHLRLFTYYTSRKNVVFLRLLDAFPRIESVHIRGVDMEEEAFTDFQARCRDRKIEVIKMTESKHTETPKTTSFTASLLHCITLISRFPFMLCR